MSFFVVLLERLGLIMCLHYYSQAALREHCHFILVQDHLKFAFGVFRRKELNGKMTELTSL